MSYSILHTYNHTHYIFFDAHPQAESGSSGWFPGLREESTGHRHLGEVVSASGPMPMPKATAVCGLVESVVVFARCQIMFEFLSPTCVFFIFFTEPCVWLPLRLMKMGDCELSYGYGEARVMEHSHFSQKIIYINAYCMLFMAILQVGLTIEMRSTWWHLSG
jgi:hypothetical protein